MCGTMIATVKVKKPPPQREIHIEHEALDYGIQPVGPNMRDLRRIEWTEEDGLVNKSRGRMI